MQGYFNFKSTYDSFIIERLRLKLDQFNINSPPSGY